MENGSRHVGCALRPLHIDPQCLKGLWGDNYSLKGLQDLVKEAERGVLVGVTTWGASVGLGVMQPPERVEVQRRSPQKGHFRRGHGPSIDVQVGRGAAHRPITYCAMEK